MKLKIVQPTKIINIVGWIIMLCLIYMKYVLQMDLPRSILLILYAVIALVSSKEELIGLCLCCIPLSTSLHYYYAIMICIFIYILKYYSHIHINSTIYIVFLLWAWELLHCFGEGFSINKSITFIFSYVLTYLLMYSYNEDIRYEYIVRLIAICTSFMCFVVLSKLLVDSGGSIDGAFQGMQRLGQIDGIEEVGAYFNPNTLGYFCIMASCGLIQLILTRKSKKIDIVLSIYLIVCGFLTTSKTFVVCLIIMIVLFVISVRGNVIRKIKNLLCLSLIFIGVFVLVDKLFPTVLENYVVRFTVNDISSGRFELLAQYNKYIFSSPETLFWGTGLSAENIKIDDFFGVANFMVPHNGFQEIIVVWGIPGLLLFFGFLFSIIMQARKSLKQQTIMNYIPLILLLIKVQAGQMVTLFPTMLMFSLAYLSLCYDFKKR